MDPSNNSNSNSNSPNHTTSQEAIDDVASEEGMMGRIESVPAAAALSSTIGRGGVTPGGLVPMVPAAQVVMLDEELVGGSDASDREGTERLEEDDANVGLQAAANTVTESTTMSPDEAAAVAAAAAAHSQHFDQEDMCNDLGLTKEQQDLIFHTEQVVATPVAAVVMAQAVQVAIDEEQPYVDPQDHDHRDRPDTTTAATDAATTAPPQSQMEVRNESSPVPIMTRNTPSDKRTPARAGVDNTRKSNLIRLLLLCVVLLLLLVGIIIAVTISSQGSSLGSDSGDNDDEADLTMTMPTPTSPPYDYPCFTSTLELLLAQLNDVGKLGDRIYILCPNTVIEVGVMENPADNAFHFKDGDYPLWAVEDNTIIQCGLDGSSSNTCVLSSGFLQVWLQPDILLPPEYRGQYENVLDDESNAARTIKNVTIRGITFEGVILNSGPFTGFSVEISQSGDVLFEDCHWKGVTSSSGLVHVGFSEYLLLRGIPLPDSSTHVTIRDSSFSDILFDASVIGVFSQNISIETTMFDNLRPSALAAPFCTFGLRDQVTFSTDDGCAGLLYCAGSAVCVMRDSCAQDIRQTGPAVVFFAHNTTTGSVTKNFLSPDDRDAAGTTCTWALGSESPTPNGGMQNFECFDGFDSSSCDMLL